MQKILILLASVVLLSGCVAPHGLMSEQAATLERVTAERDQLRADLAAARDSLQFVDDIESGQYYRDRLRLTDRINRLEFELALASEGGRTVEVILADHLFSPASADLTEAGARRLDRVGEMLSEALPGRRFRIEGHSDNVPVGPGLRDRYPSNWELSAARASAVARYLIENHDVAASDLEVLGFAETRPVAPNTTPEGRSRNRRVRIAVLPQASDVAQQIR
jgi:chemotaxis protein MotB